MIDKTVSKSHGHPLLLRNLDVVILCFLSALYIYLVPYTKIEESFNVQAVYDLLEKNWNQPHIFDHTSFPGVVPRTFLGPIVLSLFVTPFRLVYKGIKPLVLFSAVRLVLAAMSIASLLSIRSALSYRHGHIVGYFFTLITACQFHIPFYAGRPLANTFALIFTNLSLSHRIRTDEATGILLSHAILACTVAIFRSELCILLFWTVLFDGFVSKRTKFFTSCAVCITAAVSGAILSIAIDTPFWGDIHQIVNIPLRYPELEVFHFNAILGKSSAWGTSPVHWYFSNALPRALIGALPLALPGFISSRALAHRITSQTVFPSLAYVAVYSALPHKELRFIFYVIRAMNIAAAHGAAALFYASRSVPHGKGKLTRPVAERIVTAMTLGGCLAASMMVTIVSVAASYKNYPGAEALMKLRELRQCTGNTSSSISVHIDAHAAATGVSQFVEAQVRCRGWEFSREEGLEKRHLRRRFSYLIGNEKFLPGYRLIHAQESFSGIDFRAMKWRMVPDVFVLELTEDVSAR